MSTALPEDFLLGFGQVRTGPNGNFFLTPFPNPELDFEPGPNLHPNFWPNLGPHPWSGSTLSLDPDYGSTSTGSGYPMLMTNISHTCFNI